MTRDELMQDLAYARALAEEGRHAPLLGGAHLVFWGALNAGAFAAHWAALTERLPYASGLVFAGIWSAYGVIATIGMIALSRMTRGKPGASAIGARAERAVWNGAGLALCAIVVGSLGRMFMNGDPSAPNAIFGPAFAIYGTALFAVATLSQHTWMRAFAWLSLAVALTLCLFANSTWAYLYAAAGSLAALTWPGLILLKREPSAIV